MFSKIKAYYQKYRNYMIVDLIMYLVMIVLIVVSVLIAMWLKK
jgi:hypothetical protein